MVVSEYPGLRRVRPGLYESTEDPRDAVITTEFADAMRRHTTSVAAQEFLDALVSTPARQRRARRGRAARAALIGFLSGLVGLGMSWLAQAVLTVITRRGGF